jgi:hypothetical protein
MHRRTARQNFHLAYSPQVVLSAGWSEGAPTAEQVDDDYDQRDDKQKVDQPSGNVEAEAQKPEDQQNGDDCP